MEPFNLSALGITSLNEMQQASLEAHRTTNNIVLLSPTGSGKTLAFLLPLLESLDTNESNVQALILTPSRELAMQIEQVFRSLKSGFKIVCCYGGHDINVENRSLAHTPTLVVGTPGVFWITSCMIRSPPTRSRPSYWMNSTNHLNSDFRRTWKTSSLTCPTCGNAR